MKFTIRLVSAIWLSVMLVIGAFAYMQIREERERLFGDLQRRAVLVAGALSEALEPAGKQSPAAVERIVRKFGQTQRGIAVYDRFANLRSATPDIGPILPPSLPEVTEAIARNVATQAIRVVGDRNRYIYAVALVSDDQPVAPSRCCSTPLICSRRSGTAGAPTRSASWCWRSSSRSSRRWR